MRTISEIHIYPIKSLGGISLREARLTPFGLEHDRRFMLVDDAGRFISQRELPDMTQLGTAISGETLRVFHRTNALEKIEIPLRPLAEGLEKTLVEVWDSRCEACVLPENVNAWFSKMLGQRVRLVFMPDATLRPTSPEYAPGHRVSFADGYPILLIGQASLDDLNSRLAQPVPMNRFRPNLVFTGGQAYEEDDLGEFCIGAASFRGVKRCGRCVMTTIDQDSGARGTDPLRTLGTYRLRGKSIIFGENLVWLGGENAHVRLGDALS